MTNILNVEFFEYLHAGYSSLELLSFLFLFTSQALRGISHRCFQSLCTHDENGYN